MELNQFANLHSIFLTPSAQHSIPLCSRIGYWPPPPCVSITSITPCRYLQFSFSVGQVIFMCCKMCVAFFNKKLRPIDERLLYCLDCHSYCNAFRWNSSLFAFVISSIKECHPISSVFSSIEIFLSKIKFTIPGSNMTLTLIDMCTAHVPSYMHFPNIDIPNPVSIVKGII